MKNKRTLLLIVQAGVIAAVYVALTFASALLGLASGAIQVRISEALCVLPLFTPAAIPGLFRSEEHTSELQTLRRIGL